MTPTPTPAPLAISWSALRAHTECRRKAALLRAGKRNPAQNIRGYFHGMVVDGLMRRWLTDPARGRGQMAAAVHDYIEECAIAAVRDGDGVVHWKHVTDRDDMAEFCVQLLTRLEPILNELVLPYEFVSAHRFATPIVIPGLDGTPTTIILRGEMDLLVHTAPGPVVWDLKGTRDDSYWRKVLGQLLFYDLACLAETRQASVLVGLIQPMCREPVLRWELTNEHRRQMWSAIHAMATDIWRADQSCKTGSAGCSRCEVRHACPRFAPTTGGNGNGGRTMTFGDGCAPLAAAAVTR